MNSRGNPGNRGDGDVPWTREQAWGADYPAAEYTTSPPTINERDLDDRHSSMAVPVSHDQIPRSWLPSSFFDNTYHIVGIDPQTVRSMFGLSNNLSNPSSNTQSNHHSNVHEPPNPLLHPSSNFYASDEKADFSELGHQPQEVSHRQTKRYKLSEWDQMKDVVEDLFVKKRYTQVKVLDEIQAHDFYPSLSALKRKTKLWGWDTYAPRKKPVQKCPRRTRKETKPQTPLSSPSTARSVDLSTPNKSTPGGFPARSPQTVIVESSYERLPREISQSFYDAYHGSLLDGVAILYILQVPGWKVYNDREVEEDEHDDLLVGIGSSLHSLEVSENAFAHRGIRKAFHTLKKVVGTKKHQDCGFFSLPAIWHAYLRLRRQNEFLMAKVWLFHAVWRAQRRYGASHPFVKALVLVQDLQYFEETEELEVTKSEHVQHIVTNAYRRYVEVAKQLGPNNMTYLSLWADFVVYLDNSEANELLQTLGEALAVSDWNDVIYNDHSLKLLGMILYVSQSTPSMAAKAEQTSLDYLDRLKQRIRITGEPLEGELLCTKKDLLHTLGKFSADRGQYEQAVIYMEESLDLGVDDERDLYSLQKLEEWYAAYGNHVEAERVKNWWLREDEKQMRGAVVQIVSADDLNGITDQEKETVWENDVEIEIVQADEQYGMGGEA